MDSRNRYNIAIIIPALNEELAITQTIQDIPLSDAVIIVVDNGSTDNTANLARGAGAIVVSEPRKGYGYACLAGIRYLKDYIHPELVIFLDADGSDDPSILPKLIQLKARPNSPDILMGSRLDNLQAGAMATHVKIANKIFSFMINLLYRVKLTDMGPLRIMDFEVLSSLDMRDTGYGWTSELIVKALKKGYTVGEIPVVYRPRLGDSKISGSVLISLKATVWIIFHIFRNLL